MPATVAKYNAEETGGGWKIEGDRETGHGRAGGTAMRDRRLMTEAEAASSRQKAKEERQTGAVAGNNIRC